MKSIFGWRRDGGRSAGRPSGLAIAASPTPTRPRALACWKGSFGGRVQTGVDGTFQHDGIAPDEAVTLQAEFEKAVCRMPSRSRSLPERFRTEIALRIQ